jgi:hypothetical protein
MRRTLFVVAACAAAFVAGRSIPRAAPAGRAAAAEPAAVAGASVPSDASRTSPSVAPMPATSGPSSASAGSPRAADTVVAQDPTPRVAAVVPVEWRDAVRADPARASAVRQLVIEAMNVRADPAAIRECLRADGVSGGLLLRFEVDVGSETDELRVGDATFVEAVEGPPISDEAGRCIAQQLAGDELHRGDDLLDGYVGPVDYQLTINVPASR